MELGADNLRWHLHWLTRTKRPHCLDRTTSTASSFWNWERTSGGGHGSFMQCPTLAFTVDVCFQLKNRQTKPTGRTCSDSNLLAMQIFITFAEVTGGGSTGRACDDNNPHSLQLWWNLPTNRRRVAHSVTVTYGPLCMFLWLYWYATIVEKVTTITCKTFNRYGSGAPWVSWGGICQVDIPAAGCAFCDSDLQAVMHVSLAFWICHDRWKGHHNYMQHIRSIWQRSAMGLLR